MVTSCAWCRKVLADNNKNDGLLSHGICKACAADQMMPTFQVFYHKNPNFRLDETLTVDALLVNHVYVKDVKANDVADAWVKMQGENWSPNGEARGLIESKGLCHTSASVGDVFCNRKTGEYYQVDMVGFQELPA